MRTLLWSAAWAAAGLLYGCGGGGGGMPTGGGVGAPPPTATPAPALPRHVVVIVQENRSFDNLFNGFPGADTVRSGLDSSGKMRPLVPIRLEENWDVGHTYATFQTEFDAGKMDGWDHAPLACLARHGEHCTPPVTAYAYVLRRDVQPYWSLARQFAIADHVLQTNEGSSFPAHQYLIAGQSGGGDPDHLAMATTPNVPTGGCNINRASVMTIDMQHAYPAPVGNPIFPCLDYATVFDLLQAKGYTWRYYSPTFANIWAAPIAISHIWNSPSATNIVKPETLIFDDIKAHRLANVSYIVPELPLSDHSGYATNAGPDYVGSIVNAIGTDPYYWPNTAVFVVWDDWGGWFDHYATHHPARMPHDPYEYGFRVPLIAVSPYVKAHGYVDHTPRDMTAILGFIEHAFGLPSLGQRDADTDDLFSMFSFTGAAPLPYTPVDTGGYTPQSFRMRLVDTRPVDE